MWKQKVRVILKGSDFSGCMKYNFECNKFIVFWLLLLLLYTRHNRIYPVCILVSIFNKHQCSLTINHCCSLKTIVFFERYWLLEWFVLKAEWSHRLVDWLVLRSLPKCLPQKKQWKYVKCIFCIVKTMVFTKKKH